MTTEYCCEACGGREPGDTTNPLRPPCGCRPVGRQPRPRLVPAAEYEAKARARLEGPKPVVRLVGEDGNAFAIMARCRRAALAAGWPRERVDAALDEMRAGDYDHLLQVAMKHFDVR